MYKVPVGSELITTAVFEDSVKSFTKEDAHQFCTLQMPINFLGGLNQSIRIRSGTLVKFIAAYS